MHTQDFFRSTKAKVAIGIRIHDVGKLQYLRRSLTSALAQEGCSVCVIVACQEFETAELEIVKRFISEIDKLFNSKTIIINDYVGSKSDRRSKLLNLIVQRAISEGFQYISFLDYDDALLPFASRVLVNSCYISGKKFAYGDIYAEHVLTNDGKQFFTIEMKDFFNISQRTRVDLIYQNFLPIHSYIIDLSVFQDGIKYDEHLTRLEDYDVLLQIAEKFEFSTLTRNIKIGFYRFYNAPNQINTTGNIFDTSNTHDDEWEKCFKIILSKHGSLSLTKTLSEIQQENLIDASKNQ